MGEETRKELLEQVKSIENELEKLNTKTDIERYLEENILEIQRLQSLGNKGWDTVEYILLRACGGPTIYIYTKGHIKATWDIDKVEYTLSSKAKKSLRRIEDYLDSVLYFPFLLRGR